MKTRLRLPGVLLLATVMILAACGKSVSRRQATEAIDLSGRWNDVDSQEVSAAMIQDALTFGWIDQWQRTKGRKPVVMAYGVKNRSTEHINTQTFMKDLERAFLRSGRVSVVADKDERLQSREERADQQQGLTANPARIGKELGADFVLTGVLNSIVDQEGGEKVVFYQANLELINVETNEKVWIGDKKIKKFIEQSKFKL
ncbi:MAG TPA: penicillin-binding protein activator LpoB [bacterium]|nr:penicillin-binding protein activator LpoB [bacterium]